MSDRMKAQEAANEYNRTLPRHPKIMKGEKAREFLPPYPGQRKDARQPNGEGGRGPMEFGIERLNTAVGGGTNTVPPSRPREYKQPEPGPDPEWMQPRKRNVSKPRPKTERDHVKES